MFKYLLTFVFLAIMGPRSTYATGIEDYSQNCSPQARDAVARLTSQGHASVGTPRLLHDGMFLRTYLVSATDPFQETNDYIVVVQSLGCKVTWRGVADSSSID